MFDDNPRVYLSGSLSDPAALHRAALALAAAGYAVITATPSDAVDAIADDLDAVAAADAIVTLPGAEAFLEAVYAALFGVACGHRQEPALPEFGMKVSM